MSETVPKPPPRFRRLARMPRAAAGTVFVVQPEVGRRSVQEVNVGSRQLSIRVTNRPARYPKNGLWPFELRADMVAALLDFETTRQLCKAIAAGNAPRPGATRGSGNSLEVVWSLEAVKAFVAARHHVIVPDD